MDPATITAIAAAAVSTGIAIGKTVHEAKIAKRLKKMEREGGGLSEAERRQASQQAKESAGQQAGAAQQQVARDSMTDKGGRNVGLYAEAQKEIGKQATNAGAAVMPQIDALSQRVQAQRRGELLNRLGRAQDATAQAWGNVASSVGGLGKPIQNSIMASNQGNAAAAEAQSAYQWTDPNSGMAAPPSGNAAGALALEEARQKQANAAYQNG